MKILVVRFSSIGDIVLTSPVIRCIKQQITDVEVHFLTKTPFKTLLEHNPHIDRVITIDKEVTEVSSLLKEEAYDHLVDLHKNLRTNRLKAALKVPSTTFRKLNPEKWLMTNLKINRLPDAHIVDRYFEAVQKLNVQNDQEGLDFFSEGGSQNHAPFKNYIAIAIGGAHNTKRYPVDQMKEVVARLDQPIVLLGGKEDAGDGDAIAMVDGSRVFNACGKTSIQESALILKDANLVITNDTGMMHIAAAFRKKILSIWGNTIPEFGMTPYMPGDEKNAVILEEKGLSCRPCSKIGYEKCPKGHFKCMKAILPERLVKEARRLI